MKYKIKIHEEALSDIQEATDWYNEQTKGLGSRFQKQVIAQINSLNKNPDIYKNRYANVRCMLVKHVPFMVHYEVDYSLLLVEVFAVVHTSRNPKIWFKKRK